MRGRRSGAGEPTGNLDERIGDEVVRLLLEICALQRAASVLVTHDPAHAKNESPTWPEIRSLLLSPVPKMNSAPSDFLEKLYKELSQVPDLARVQSTVAHCYLELLVHLLAIEKCKNGGRITKSGSDYSHAFKVTLLHEGGVISDWESEILHWFRRMRNAAAHRVEFSLTSADLDIFRGRRMAGSGEALDEPKHFGLLCLDIVLGFWHKHVQFFNDRFSPSN